MSWEEFIEMKHKEKKYQANIKNVEASRVKHKLCTKNRFCKRSSGVFYVCVMFYVSETIYDNLPMRMCCQWLLVLYVKPKIVIKVQKCTQLHVNSSFELGNPKCTFTSSMLSLEETS